MKRLEDKFLSHEPSPVAQELFDSLSKLDREVIKDIASVIRSNVGWGKSSYKEIVYTLYAVSEGKTPPWLGGEDGVPDIVRSPESRSAVANVIKFK